MVEVKATYWAVIGADKPAVNITMATQGLGKYHKLEKSAVILNKNSSE